MNVWQLFAAVLAVVVALAVLARLRRDRRGTTVVLVLQLALIPEVAFVWYAVYPSASPAIEGLAPIAVGFYAIGIASIVLSLVQRRLLMRPSVSLGLIDAQHMVALVARIGLVIFLAGIAFVFVPSLGLLDLVANALWIALWIPRRLRRTEVRLTYDLAANPTAVFDFVSNTDNWPAYRDDFVSANPPGRLRVGTEIATRLPLNRPTRRGERLPRFVDVRSTVTTIGPGRAYSLAVIGRRYDASRSQVEDGPEGSRVTASASGLLSFAQGALGFTLEMPGQLAARRRTMENTAARLRQSLEQA